MRLHELGCLSIVGLHRVYSERELIIPRMGEEGHSNLDNDARSTE
jgi:hypothetical protein